MPPLSPRTPAELANALAKASAERKSIQLGGAFTKDRFGGPIRAADVIISTANLNRILQYEPNDLTISVEAGLPYADLQRTLAAQSQMIPLDPPFADRSTVGGVVAANSSGPRRRLYGTARDVVIGMQFATLEGKLVQSGGMVVKNVAGLDMGKLLIGSFGTLAALAIINFKVAPMPKAERTFVMHFPSLEEAIAERDRILKGLLHPAALDLLNPRAAALAGQEGYTLLAQVGGSEALLERYSREFAHASSLDSAHADTMWRSIREFTPGFLSANRKAIVIRISLPMAELGTVLQSLNVPALARAANGVCYAYFSDWETAAAWITSTASRNWRVVVEAAADSIPDPALRWPKPSSDFAMMVKIKEMFDPHGLLNKGRLYGRI